MILAPLVLQTDTFPDKFDPELGASASYVMTRRFVDTEDEFVTEWQDRMTARVQQRDSLGNVVLEFKGQPVESKSSEKRDHWHYTLTLGPKGEFRDRSEDSEDALLAIRYALAGVVIRPPKPVAVGGSWVASANASEAGLVPFAYRYKFVGNEKANDKIPLMKLEVNVEEKKINGLRMSGWMRIRRDNQLTYDAKLVFDRAFLAGDELRTPQRLTLTLASN